MQRYYGTQGPGSTAELRHPTGPQKPAAVNKQEGDWDNNLHVLCM